MSTDQPSSTLERAATKAPRITAADVRGALSRLRGVIILDVADLSVAPALFDPRAGEFHDLAGNPLGPDDGSLIVLVDHDQAAEVLEAAGRPCDAAAILSRQVADLTRRGLL